MQIFGETVLLYKLLMQIFGETVFLYKLLMQILGETVLLYKLLMQIFGETVFLKACHTSCNYKNTNRSLGSFNIPPHVVKTEVFSPKICSFYRSL
jgi:hypothetical protein